MLKELETLNIGDYKLHEDVDCPYKILQTKREAANLIDIYKTLKPGNVLEIGVNYGGSLFGWMKHACPETNIIGVDIAGGPFCDGGYKEDQAMYNAWTSWASNYKVKFTMI